MDQNHDRQRGQSHRPRRGADRRSPSRRPPARRLQDRPGRDQVDVEQIMQDIRGRIALRQGIDLSNQQIQDLAARRLESILDPRAIKPSLLDGLRRGAAVPTDSTDKIPNEPVFFFEDTTLYDSHRALLRFARRLLNPLLKLLFNPNPLIRALHLQAKLNVEALERNAERDRRQTEWNALHFEIVQRLVTEVSRVSLELQALSMRVEALGARVDFNDRRVGHLEGSAHRARPQERHPESAGAGPVSGDGAPTGAVIASGETSAPDAARRRRRRRRGRRSGSGTGEDGLSAPPEAAVTVSTPIASVPGPPPVTDESPGEDREKAAAPDSAPATVPGETLPPPAPVAVEPESPQLPLSSPNVERHED